MSISTRTDVLYSGISTSLAFPALPFNVIIIANIVSAPHTAILVEQMLMDVLGAEKNV
ncbi:hypothetical protein [Dickeya dianthicola]|uniref:hypothetical protein n=1 Tax=Dickeya dianthicola TaxID=204039 RepID=UPI0003D79356|nr:hypothetical protein [Dickeya dianthicola]MCI4031468.1 hypothetical protein [Dickeya dianthicola]MCI4174606.1 hypothetical protein [Dickeya dianthicola]MCI4179534.1 hypothetical protein [Dickeya dianthicola]MCI4180359.1 hypothetical protein [Dickeya dianthicola]MCI4194042.1 hypothetical protein [Dickeya dianthicola]